MQCSPGEYIKRHGFAVGVEVSDGASSAQQASEIGPATRLELETEVGEIGRVHDRYFALKRRWLFPAGEASLGGKFERATDADATSQRQQRSLEVQSVRNSTNVAGLSENRQPRLGYPRPIQGGGVTGHVRKSATSFDECE